MAVNLKGRNLVSLKDFSTEEILETLKTADTLKLERLRGPAHPKLTGKTLAMIFQKPSLRTRVSFEAGMTQLVGHDIVVDLAKYATVPVINGLSDEEHPCQVLADLQTVRERKGTLAGLKLGYLGDGNNVAHSLMYGCARVGMSMTAVTPPGYEPLQRVRTEAAEIGRQNNCTIEATTDIEAGVKGADVVYTDVWASMGQEAEAAERARLFAPYQVNKKLMSLADPKAIILHCLPAHYGEEIDYEASRLPGSAIFDQAENRLHAQKALMVLLAA